MAPWRLARGFRARFLVGSFEFSQLDLLNRRSESPRCGLQLNLYYFAPDSRSRELGWPLRGGRGGGVLGFVAATYSRGMVLDG
jgi:hypothetical protein